MHACLPASLSVWTEPDRIGPLLISYLASNQLTCSVGDNDGHTAVPMRPPFPNAPQPTPDLFSGGLIPLSLSDAVRISSPDNALSTTVDLNALSTNFPRPWA